MILKNLYVTGDTHYHHKNICKGTTRYEVNDFNGDHLGFRDFQTLEEMNDNIINTFNSIVGKDDTLLHVGDVSFGGVEYVEEFLDRLVCKNVILCMGNHDRHILFNRQNIRDKFLLVTNVLNFKYQVDRRSKAIPIFASHYSHRVWEGHHKGVYHLFGHSHGSLDYLPNGRSMDVGIDTAKKRFNEYRPYHIEEALHLCNKNSINLIDKHG